MKRASILTVTILFLVSAYAFPQGGGNAALTGTVSDPTGAVVPGAQITVTQQGTSFKRTGISNASGAFTIPSLPPASYSISVEAAGFKTSTQTITLLADQIRALDVHLEIGQTTQQVTVEATPVLVNTVTPVLNNVIEQTRVVSIPLTTRNAADLTLLVPGTTNANGHGVQQGNTKQIAVGNTSVAESIAVNGARPDQISYNLDGADNEDLMSNTNNPFPFPDALQEFSVQTNSFDVQYGANAGAVVNVVTKSGTNQWHGDGFEFVRNKVFDARNFFATPPKGSTDSRDPLKQNQYGATVGGPIKKDNSFIFFGYQGTRIRTVNNSSNAVVPTPAEMSGNFSAICKSGFDASGVCLDRASNGNVIDQIYNPATGLPFANNMGLPVDPVAASFAKLLPISSADANGNVTFQTPQVQNLNEFVARFDQNIRGTDRLFARFHLDRFHLNPPYDGKDLLTVAAGSTVQSQNYAVGYTWIAGPTFVNNLVLSVVREASDRGQGGQVPQMTDFGASIFQLPKSEGGIRSFSISNFFSIGNFTDAKFVRNTGDIRDQATWTHGTHTFSFGGDLEHDQSNIRNTDLENGSWSFTTDTSRPAGVTASSAQAAANFVLGHMRSYSQTSGDFSDSRENVVGIYFADKWKFRPRLTLNGGIRWEPQSVMKEIFGRTEQFRPDAYAAGVVSKVIPSAPPGVFFVGDSYNGIGFPPTGETADLNNFAPRAGFAYDISGTGKTVVRGGGGVFYSTRLPGLFLNDASISQPFSLRVDLTEPSSPNSLIPLDNPLASQPSFAAGFPQRFTLATMPAGVAFKPPIALFGLEPGRKWVTPTIYDWNLTVERQLRPDTVLHVSYVGLRGTHLREDINLNPRAVGVGTDASRPYSATFGNILENRNNGMSNYNALQVDIEKRPGGGSGILRNVTLLANYTYSKAMDIALASNGGTTDVGSSVGSGRPFGDPLQGAFDTGPSDFDHTHKLVASFVWDLPQFAGKSALAKWTLGGWQWSGIYTVTSGDALTILAGADASKTNLGGDRAQFIGSASQYGGVAPASSRGGCPTTGSTICVPWLNTALFAASTPTGTFGNVGKGAFRGPTNWNADMGLHKTFYPMSSHENFSMQLRGEFFNIFNHTQLNDTASSNTYTRSSGNFGSIRGAYDPRIIQLALKVFF
jgi:Carboxypeptidase regulatory-like domain